MLQLATRFTECGVLGCNRYASNIGVLLLNKLLLTNYGFKCAPTTHQALARSLGNSGRTAAVVALLLLDISHRRPSSPLSRLWHAVNSVLAVCRYPIFLTMCHMLSCSFMGYAFSRFSSLPTKSVRGGLVLTKIAVLATVFCLSVVLGNASLRFIPVSFNQSRRRCSLLNLLVCARHAERGS